MYLIFLETRVIGLHFCRCMYGSIFIQICAVGSKRRIFSAPKCVLAVQGRSGSSKVDDFGTNRKRVEKMGEQDVLVAPPMILLGSNCCPCSPDSSAYDKIGNEGEGADSRPKGSAHYYEANIPKRKEDNGYDESSVTSEKILDCRSDDITKCFLALPIHCGLAAWNSLALALVVSVTFYLLTYLPAVRDLFSSSSCFLFLQPYHRSVYYTVLHWKNL